MCDLIFSVQEFLKIVPGLILFPFSIYLAYLKLGKCKVSASFTTSFGRTSETRISQINITNLKDRSLNIFSIYAVINKDIAIEIDTFDPPIILKGLESTRIETNKYSKVYIGDERYKPEFLLPNKVQIFINTESGLVKCNSVTHPSLISLSKFNKFRLAIKSTSKFNGKVYNENCKYAITYLLNSNQHTAFIENSGFISEEWYFSFNTIPQSHMRNKDTVSDYLKTSGFDKIIQGFIVDELK